MNTSTPSLPVLMSCDEGPRTVSSEPPVSGRAVSVIGSRRTPERKR